MRRLVESTKHRIAHHIDQREELLLVVHASDADSVFILQLVGDLDETSAEDLCLLFGGAFTDANAYALMLAQAFTTQHARAAVAVLEAGQPPLPPLPGSLLAVGTPAHQRLQQILTCAGRLLPRDARRLVVSIAPESIADRTSYLALIGSLLPRQERPPWLSRLRLIIRDVSADVARSDDFGRAEKSHPLMRLTSARMAVTSFDFGAAAQRAAMQSTVEDEASPMEVRMQALLAAAIIDGAHDKRRAALESLDYLLSYHQQTQNVLMQAVTVNAMGDVCRGGGARRPAQHWYECALALALKSRQAFVLATVLMNLGSLEYENGRHPVAAEYFRALGELALEMLDAETSSFALEWQGLSWERAGQLDRAIEAWRAGTELCRNTDNAAGVDAHATHLARVKAPVRRADAKALLKAASSKGTDHG